MKMVKFLVIGLALIVFILFCEPGNTAKGDEPKNMLLNPSFESDKEKWLLYVEAGDATFEVVKDKDAPEGKKVAEVNIINPADMRVELDSSLSFLFTLEERETYTCSFWMKSENKRAIASYINHRAPPWTPYSDKPWFQIDNEWKEYFYTFAMNNPSDSECGLVLQLTANFGWGEAGPLRSIKGYIWVDNVKLYLGKYRPNTGQRQTVEPRGKLTTRWGIIKAMNTKQLSETEKGRI